MRLGSEMLTALQQALDEAGRDESVRVVVLAAAARRFARATTSRTWRPTRSWRTTEAVFAQCGHRMMLTMQDLSVPVIARVQGMATAAGCQLVAQCDLAVAADSASLPPSGIHYGLFCAAPSVPPRCATCPPSGQWKCCSPVTSSMRPPRWRKGW